MAAPSIVFNILAKDIEASARFYGRIANMREVFRSDWTVVMEGPNGNQIAMNDHVSQFAPRLAGGMAAGGYFTIFVDDVYAAYALAGELGVEQVDAPRALEDGETRALIRDPNGFVIELSTPTRALDERLRERNAVEAESTTVNQ